MRQEYERDEEYSFIDNIAKELYGYDDAALQKEMDEAESAWEQQKASDPEAEAQNHEATQCSFKAIKRKIEEQEMKAVSRKAYAKRQKKDRRKVVNLKRCLKIGVVAAALHLLLLGVAMEGMAFKKFGYRLEKVGTVKNKVVWNDEQYQVEAGGLDEAYQEIEGEIGIPVIVFGYKPKGMKFKDIYIDKGNSRITLSDGEKVIYLRETKYHVNHVSTGFVADPEDCIKVFNRALNCELLIQKNDLENGLVEYWTDINLGEAYYNIFGIIDEYEFIKMIEELNFYQ